MKGNLKRDILFVTVFLFLFTEMSYGSIQATTLRLPVQSATDAEESLDRRSFIKRFGALVVGVFTGTSLNFGELREDNNTSLATISDLIESQISYFDETGEKICITSPVSPIKAFNDPDTGGARGRDWRAAFRDNSYKPIKAWQGYSLENYNNSSGPFWDSLLSEVEKIQQSEVKEELKKFYQSLQENFIQVIKALGKEPDFIEQSKLHISTMKDFDQVMKVLEEHFSPESIEKWRIAMERLFESFYGWAGHSLMVPDGENVYRPIADAGVMYLALHFVSFDRDRVPKELWDELVTYTPRLPDYKNYWLNRANLLPTPETTAVTPWPLVEAAIEFMQPFTGTDRLLDLGCGELLPMFDFIKEGFTGNIEAHDYSPEMVKRAKINRDAYLLSSKDRDRIQIFENDITTEKFQKSVESRIRLSGKFNKITMIDVIQDLPQTTVKPTLEWVIKKALAEGGKLFISILLERDREFYVRDVEEVLDSLKVSHGLTIEKKEWNPGDTFSRWSAEPYIFTQKRVTLTISRSKSSELEQNDGHEKSLNRLDREIDGNL